ncbi:MAG: AzlC family ABC transporter permease [Alphaproteobacteria bacterium]
MPAFILMMSYVGFGALAQEAGLSVTQAAFSTAVIWALPSQVVLAGALAAGTSIGLVALAVALASVRLTPMVAAWVPVVRGPKSTKLSLVLMSQFVAITAWIVTMNRMPDIPREGRGAFFVGFASSLTVCNTLVTILSFIVAGELSDNWRAALLFLTPIYFLTSLTAAANLPSDRFALLFGLIFGPLIYMTGIQLDLLFSGLLAGTLAFFVDKQIKKRAARG